MTANPTTRGFCSPRRSASRRATLAALLLSTAIVPAAFADALPTGGQVAAGAAAIAADGGAMTITQGTDRAVIRWDGFSVGAGARVDVLQPGAGSALLNRVTGALPSRIDGALSANGQVFLVNPSGIVVGPGGRVDAAGFVASTLDIDETDFMEGRLSFGGNGSSAEVRNEGTIGIGRGGYAALLGGRVVNTGTISVPFGRVGLGAGERATLDLSGDGFLQVTVPSGSAAEEALIAHTGRIDAPGGRVEMLAATARDAARQAVNLSGVVEARSVAQIGGAIVLGGGPGGAVSVSGRLDVSAAVELSPVPKPRPAGGSVTITGETIALDGARIAADGPGGGGEVRIGGDLKGGGDLPRARSLTESGTTITADATVAGNGGRVILWSDDATRFTGVISARGGPEGGDGGFVEVSGARRLAFAGQVDTRAPGGATGTLLLDPANFLIVDGPLVSPPFNVLATEDIEATLATTNFIVNTSSGDIPGDPGDITVNGDITWTSPNELLFLADNDVFLNASVTGPSGTFRIDAGGEVLTGPGGAVDVAAFALESGNWVQNGPALPAFSADNFYIFPGASFLRAGGGTGAAADPYILTDVYGLQGIGTSPALLAGTWRLGNGIDASGTSGWDPGAFGLSVFDFGLVPIGVFTPFTGSLDGAGFAIGGLTVSNADAAMIGTIGAGGRVTNLTLTGVNISNGSAFSGAAAGLALANAGTVSGVTVTGSVTGSGSGGVGAGGIVGANSGLIENAVFSGNLSFDNGFSPQVGGVAGSNSGTIAGSRSAGTVTVESSDDPVVGGLVGSNGGSVERSRSAASVVVDGSALDTPPVVAVGGLAGENFGSITASQAEGPVSASVVQGDVGGFVGRNVDLGEVTGTITLSRADGDVTVEGSSGNLDVGGFVGQNSGIVSQTEAHGSVSVTGADGTVRAGGHTGIGFGGLIEDSLARGAVSVAGPASGSVGGFVGAAAFGTIRRTFSSGAIEAATIAPGGFMGNLLASPPTVQASFWDVTASGLTTSAAGTGLTTAEFQDTAGFIALAQPLGWSFTNPVWAPGAPGRYPALYATTPVIFAVPDDVTAVRGLMGPGTLTGQVFGGPGLYVLGPPGDTVDVSSIFQSPGFPSGAPGLYPVTSVSGLTSAGGTTYTVVGETATLTVLPGPGDGDGINILPPILPVSLPNPEDVIRGLDSSVLGEAEAALRELERVAQALAVEIELCRQSEPGVGDALGCVSEALGRLAATLEAIRLELPPALQNVSSVIEAARQDIEASRRRAEARIAAATTAEERDAIAREALGEARAALAVASDEIRKSIALIRAEDPELTRLQVEQGNAILASLRAVDGELQRAVGL